MAITVKLIVEVDQKGAVREFREFSGELGKGTQKTTAFAGQLGNLGKMFVGGMGVGAGIALFNNLTSTITTTIETVGELSMELLDLSIRGGQVSAMQNSFIALAGGVEQAGEYLQKTQAASRGLISDFQIMSAANKALLLQLPTTSDEMATLTRSAITLGQAMGQSATKSLDDLITALGRGSPLILDNLGIMVKVSEANTKYAATIGKTASQLTETEKKMAFYNAAVEAANVATEKIGGVQLTAGQQAERASAEWENLTDQLGVLLAQNPQLGAALGSLIDIMIDLSKVILNNKETINKWISIGAISMINTIQTIVDMTNMLIKVLGTLGVTFAHQMDFFDKLSNISPFAKPLKKVLGMGAYEEGGWGNIAKGMQAKLAETDKAMQGFSDRMAKIMLKVADAQKGVFAPPGAKPPPVIDDIGDSAETAAEKIKKLATILSKYGLGPKTEKIGAGQTSGYVPQLMGSISATSMDTQILTDMTAWANEFSMDVADIDTEIKRTGLSMADLASVTSGFRDLLGLVGISSDTAFGKVIGGAGAAVSAIGSVGAAFGKDETGATGSTAEKALAGMGLVGAGIGLAGAVVGSLKKEGWEKAVDETMRDYGIRASESLGKAIEETDKRITGGRFEATLLNLGDLMGEAFAAGGDASQFEKGITDLLNAIELGAVPAGEGLQAVGSAWDQLAQSAQDGSWQAEKALVDMMRQAEATGNVPANMAAEMAAGVDKMTSGLDLILGGLQEIGPVQGEMFADTFWTAMGEKGPRAAADALKDSWSALKDSGVEIGGEVGRLMALSIENEAYRGASDVGQGLVRRVAGMRQAGIVSAGGFAATGATALQAYGQAIGGGATDKEALATVLPYLAEARQTAALYGLELDANTARLITQAETMGYAFPAEPMERMVSLMEQIVLIMGGALPEAAGVLSSSTSGAVEQAAGTISDSMGGALQQTTYRLGELQMQASGTSQTIGQEFAGTGSIVDDTANMVVDGLDYARMGINIMAGTSMSALGGVITSAQTLAGVLGQVAGAAGTAGSAVGNIPTVGGGPGGPPSGIPGYASGIPGSPVFMPQGGLLRYHAGEHVGVWKAGSFPRGMRVISAAGGFHQGPGGDTPRLPGGGYGGGGYGGGSHGGGGYGGGDAGDGGGGYGGGDAGGGGGGNEPPPPSAPQIASEVEKALAPAIEAMAAAVTAKPATVIHMGGNTYQQTTNENPLHDLESKKMLRDFTMNLTREMHRARDAEMVQDLEDIMRSRGFVQQR